MDYWQKSLGLMLLAVIICTSLFFFIPNSNSNLAIQVKNPEFWQFYTSSFVHIDTNHLLSNMLVFSIAVLFQIYIAKKSGRGKVFFISLLAIILLIPIIDTLFQKYIMTMMLPNYQNSMGFSGVAAAALGLIPFTIFSYLHFKGLKRNAAQEFMLASILLNASFFCMIYATKLNILILWVATILFLAGFLFLALRDRDRIVSILNIVRNETNRWLWWALAATTVIFVFFAPLLLYPEKIIQDGSFIDFLTHLISLMVGIFIGYIVFGFDTPDSS